MATEYSITYTYIGQGNTSATRSVPFSRFKASGDTGRTIGQIREIRYVHYHTSTRPATWALRGRLVFGDGTTITSPSVSKSISGDVVEFVNKFDTLPTAEQFAKLSSVQTLDNDGKTTVGDGATKLYWRATDKYKMKIIVKFVEEPPVVFAPSVETFKVQRVNEDSIADDEGKYIATTLKLSIGNAAGLTGAQCRIYYAADAYPQVGASQYVDLTSKISTLITGVSLNTTILTGVWSLSSIWNFAVVFIAGDETAIATGAVARGTVSFHVSGEPGGGAAVGGFSSGTSADPKFESHVPAHFYAGIKGVTDYSSGEIKTGGKWIDGKPIYRRSLSGSVSTSDGTAKTEKIGTLSDIDAIVGMFGSVYRETSYAWHALAVYAHESNYHRVTYIGNTGAVNLTTTHSARVFLTVEYTKTTD